MKTELFVLQKIKIEWIKVFSNRINTFMSPSVSRHIPGDSQYISSITAQAWLFENF